MEIVEYFNFTGLVMEMKNNMPDDLPSFFTKMVDELVLLADTDPELKGGLEWLDGRAQKTGSTIYQQVFETLHKHDVNTKAKQWLKEKDK